MPKQNFQKCLINIEKNLKIKKMILFNKIVNLKKKNFNKIKEIMKINKIIKKKIFYVQKKN